MHTQPVGFPGKEVWREGLASRMTETITLTHRHSFVSGVGGVMGTEGELDTPDDLLVLCPFQVVSSESTSILTRTSMA